MEQHNSYDQECEREEHRHCTSQGRRRQDLGADVAPAMIGEPVPSKEPPSYAPERKVEDISAVQ